MRLVRERKKQELHDYVVVCIQRLDKQPPNPPPYPEGHASVHAIIEQTIRRWKD